MTALVAAPATLTTPFVSHIRLSNDNDSDGMTMINVFLKMWDGKVGNTTHKKKKKKKKLRVLPGD